LSLDVHIVGHIKFEMINIGGSPGIGDGEGSDGDKGGGERVKDLKEPWGTRSGNTGVHLDGVSADDIEIVTSNGSLKVEEGLVGIVASGGGRRSLGHKIRVFVILISLLVGVSQSGKSSGWDDGGSENVVDLVGNRAASGGNQGINLSTDSSSGVGDFKVSLSIGDGREVRGDGNP
jgi:hypothetical protein